MSRISVSTLAFFARVRDLRQGAPFCDAEVPLLHVGERDGWTSPADRAAALAACRGASPRFVWLEVDPDEALDWLVALAEARLPVALAAPPLPTAEALRAALAHPRVATLPTAIALPRLYAPGPARLIALAAQAGAARVKEVRGRLVLPPGAHLARDLDDAAAYDATLAAVEEAVALATRLGCAPANLTLTANDTERFLGCARLASTADATPRVEVELADAPLDGPTDARAEWLRVAGTGWAVEWRVDAGGARLVVERPGGARSQPLPGAPWWEALAAAFERHVAGETGGWLTLASHADELTRALELTHGLVYGHDREVRLAARRRALDAARRRGPFWSELDALPTARAGHQPVFVASPAQCLALARPLARGFHLLLVRAPSPVAADNRLAPMGLAQLAAAVEPLGVTTTLVDLAPLTGSRERPRQARVELPAGVVARALAGRLGDTRWDLAGVSWADAGAWPLVRDEVAPALRAAAPRVVGGGVEAARSADEALALGAVDYLLCGEAELGLVALIRHLAAGEPLSAVPGVIAAGIPGSQVAPPVVPSFAWTGVPRYDGLDLSFYRPAVPGLQAPFLPYQTSRGCPFACAFCADETSHRVRERPPASVVRDLAALRDRHGVRDFFFLDNLLNVNRRFLQGLLDALEHADLGVRFVDCARPADLDDTTLARLARVGCTQLTFGVDAPSDRMLGLMNKRFQMAEAEHVIVAAHRAGIGPVVNLITAMPGETEADFEEGLRLVERLRPHVLGFRVMSYNFNAGSPLYGEPARFGLRRRGERYAVVDGDGWKRSREVREERTRRLREVVGDSEV